MKLRSTFLGAVLASVILLGATASSWADLANAWHIPFNSEVPTGLAPNFGSNGPFQMRSPYVEIGPSTLITFFQGYYKGDGSNQNGGKLWYRAEGGSWTSTDLHFHADVNAFASNWNQYWYAQLNSNTFPAN